MSKANVTDEVAILRFFEKSPIEKAEIVFNIVKEKMRGRLAENGHAERPKKKRHSAGQTTEEPMHGQESVISSSET